MSHSAQGSLDPEGVGSCRRDSLARFVFQKDPSGDRMAQITLESHLATMHAESFSVQTVTPRPLDSLCPLPSMLFPAP